MRQDIISVSELLKEMKETINQNDRLQNVALIGEVSNFSAHRSGHFYFNLKDETSRIACVMFKTSASKILFKPKEGDKVVLVGAVGVFEASGSVQFYANKMILDGLGQLHQQYELLKQDFQKRGYFNLEHKKQIPAYPHSIAIITGQGSAAYADMNRTLNERWPFAKVQVLYSLVQGPSAKDELATRIAQADALNVDVIVIARGGGSIEDLWSFNDPLVVEAIWNAKTPIISGVGHESDTTLSDLVADFRAATPTAAIVAATPLASELKERLRSYMNQFYSLTRRKLLKEKQNYDHIMNSSMMKNPLQMVDRQAHLLDYHKQSLQHALRRFDNITLQVQRFELRSMNQVLEKIQKQTLYLNKYDEFIISNIKNRLQSETINLDKLDQNSIYKLKQAQQNIQYLKVTQSENHQRLIEETLANVQLKHKSLTDIMKVLHTLSPLAIMAKGYSLTYHEGSIIKSVDQVEINDTIKVRYQDGDLLAQVMGKESYDE